MEIDYLISMTDFVIENENMINQTESEMSKDLFRLAQYAHFLKQKLEPCMFVPCKKVNDKWVFLEYPEVGREKKYNSQDSSTESIIYHEQWHLRIQEYNEAKERVLFKGKFTEYDLEIIFKEDTIEKLCHLKLKLTNTAKKQINP